jgi:hypothetical protein
VRVTRQGAFPFDEDLPGLVTAANPAAIGPLLAGQLWPAGGVRVLACRLSRIRYRPRTRCFVQYALTIQHDASGERRTQWVTGALYRDDLRAAHLARTLARTAPQPLHALDPLPVTLIPGIDMLASAFPFDRKLPQAPALLSGRDPMLEDVVRRTFGDGTWTIEEWCATPVRYREHLSLVIRLRVSAREVQTHTRMTMTYYVKAYPDRAQARSAYEHLVRLAAYADDAGLGFRIDAPLACLDHLNACVVPSALGRPLDSMLEDSDDGALIRALRDAAHALACFNVSDAPTTRRYTVAEHLTSIERATTLLECACPDLRDDLRAVLAAVASQARDTELRPTHRDMKPEHILLDGRRPGFIDLDSCAAAEPVLDVALMLARFAALASGHADHLRLSDAAALFAAEYFARVPAGWKSRLPPCYASSLVDVAAGILHRQEHEWQRRVALLVREAAATVRGRDVYGITMTEPVAVSPL